MLKLLAAVFLLALPHAVLGCGMINSHIEINHRAAHYFSKESSVVDFNKLLRENLDALQPGSSFPDTFYFDGCFLGEYYYVSEDTHWSPFIKAAFTYFHRTYPGRWELNEDARKLAVFLLGILGHQTADILWHSIGVEQGFLDTSGKVNYHDVFDGPTLIDAFVKNSPSAHTDGDFGGDVLNGFENNMDYVGKTSRWYVPSLDLMGIYQELYGHSRNMTREVLEGCTFLAYLLRLGGRLGVLDVLYPMYAERGPFLVDSLNDYFLGGTDDMAVWIQNQWREAAEMLEHGPEVCNLNSNNELPHNPLAIRCSGNPPLEAPYDTPAPITDLSRLTYVHTGQSPLFRQVLADLSDLLKLNSLLPNTSVVTTVTNKAVIFSLADDALNLIKNTVEKVEDTLVDTLTGVNFPSNNYNTQNHYSKLGQYITVGDLNNDGFLDAVISAPGYSVNGNYQQGRVYIVYGTANGVPKANLNVEDNANQTLDGSSTEKNSRFGWATLVLDVNGDGLNDLVVSAPSAGSRALQYFGMVYLYLSPGTGKPLPSQPSKTILCTIKYCNLGYTLAAGDINNDGKDDLIIGSPFALVNGPQRGMVGAFFSGPNLVAKASLNENDFDWRFNGQKDYQMAGFSISCKKTVGGTPILAVGAPYHRISASDAYAPADTQSAGKVFIFKLPSAAPKDPQPATTIQGTNAFEQLGYFVQVDRWNKKDVVIVSSTTEGDPGLIAGFLDKKQVGIVRFYEIKSNNDVDTSKPALTLYGDDEFGRFGSAVKVFESSAGTPYVLVSAPFVTATVTPLLNKHETGRVFLYKSTNILGLLKTFKHKTLGIKESKARFGSALAVVQSSDKKKIELLVGAKHYTPIDNTLQQNADRFVGRVSHFDLATLL